MAVQAIPKGYHSVTPSIMVKGASQAIDFYTKAFGAKEMSRFTGPDGLIMHAVIQIGNSMIMLGDEMEGPSGRGPNALGGTPVSLFIYQDNIDSLWKQAIKAGGKEIMPLADQFWGDRAGCLQDPFGHHWWLAQHINDPTEAELKAGAEQAMAAAK